MQFLGQQKLCSDSGVVHNQVIFKPAKQLGCTWSQPHDVENGSSKYPEMSFSSGPECATPLIGSTLQKVHVPSHPPPNVARGPWPRPRSTLETLAGD